MGASLRYFFFEEAFTPPLATTAGNIDPWGCRVADGELHTRYSIVKACLRESSAIARFAEYTVASVHEPLIVRASTLMLLLSLLFSFVFSKYQRTAWISDTLSFSVSQMTIFVPVVIAMAVCFAYVTFVSFGGSFANFSTFGKAFRTLFISALEEDITREVPLVRGTDDKKAIAANTFDAEAYELTNFVLMSRRALPLAVTTQFTPLAINVGIRYYT